MKRLHDRRVIVTGAGSGIGAATVRRLLDEGAHVIAVDVSAGGLAETQKTCTELGVSEKLSTEVLDISDPERVAATIDIAVQRLTGIDVLVNAAGILLTDRTHEMTLDRWNRIIAVNLTGTFLMIRSALPHLLQSPYGGVLVNFSSTSAFFAHPYMAAYAATKGAITSMTHSIALEYAKQGLRAVNIVPGGITSAITTKSILDLPEDFDHTLFTKLHAWLGGGNLGAPEDVASVVAMLASDDGKFISGTEIRIDGGAHM